MTYPPHVPLTYTAVAATTGRPSDTFAYAWTFDDGSKGAGASLSHTWDNVGPHTATVTATDDQLGTSASTKKTVDIQLPYGIGDRLFALHQVGDNPQHESWGETNTRINFTVNEIRARDLSSRTNIRFVTYAKIPPEMWPYMTYLSWIYIINEKIYLSSSVMMYDHASNHYAVKTASVWLLESVGADGYGVFSLIKREYVDSATADSIYHRVVTPASGNGYLNPYLMNNVFNAEFVPVWEANVTADTVKVNSYNGEVVLTDSETVSGLFFNSHLYPVFDSGLVFKNDKVVRSIQQKFRLGVQDHCYDTAKADIEANGVQIGNIRLDRGYSCRSDGGSAYISTNIEFNYNGFNHRWIDTPIAQGSCKVELLGWYCEPGMTCFHPVSFTCYNEFAVGIANYCQMGQGRRNGGVGETVGWSTYNSTGPFIKKCVAVMKNGFTSSLLPGPDAYGITPGDKGYNGQPSGLVDYAGPTSDVVGLWMDGTVPAAYITQRNGTFYVQDYFGQSFYGMNYTHFNLYAISDTAKTRPYSIFSQVLSGGQILHIEKPEGITPELWLDDVKIHDLN